MNYLKITQIALLFFLLFSTARAQERYKEEITDSVRVETFTYAYKDGQSLEMDVYFPANDNQLMRPLILYVHGGGFSGGTRNDLGIIKFCERLSRYGYVVGSISYRLTRQGTTTGFGCDCPAADKRVTFKKAVEDLQYATYFMINNREKMGIDPYSIILSGSSAGAETALNTAYQPPYCYDLKGGPVSYAGVISMAGAIPDTSKIYTEAAVPSLLFHGTCDNLVPYATAPHRYCKREQAGYLILNGGYTIAEKLKKLGTPYWLYTFCNASHEIAGEPMTKNFNDIIDFCYSYVVKKSNEQRTTIIKSKGSGCADYQSFDFCSE